MATDEPAYTAPDLSLVGAPHVQRYLETGGQEGGEWNGVPILLLTTIGRHSGERRTSALIFGRDGDDLLVVASQGGAPTHPAWYLNLSADPQVEVQVMDDVQRRIAHTASAEEKPRLWSIMTAAWPNYDVYTTRTDREIPLVVLSKQ
jgi:deazaflavin-dependent oxidoreductase (nitroreductase family)